MSNLLAYVLFKTYTFMSICNLRALISAQTGVRGRERCYTSSPIMNRSNKTERAMYFLSCVCTAMFTDLSLLGFIYPRLLVNHLASLAIRLCRFVVFFYCFDVHSLIVDFPLS